MQIKDFKLKKIILGFLVLSGFLYAQDSTISYEYGVKDYNNSMTKVDGRVQNLSVSHKISNHQIYLGYQGDNVNRKHSITNAILPSLDVENIVLNISINIMIKQI